jgi:four helix bundle protein
MEDEAPVYDLEERTYQFALQVRRCISGTKWTREQWTDVDQVLRSSGSVAANYIEANNAVSKRDFLLRIRISKKEASECQLWLRLLGETSNDEALKLTIRKLHKESDELTRILATILRNSQT